MKRTLAALGTMAALLMVPVSARASASALHTFGTCTGHGQYAVCVASGTLYKPVNLYVYAYARPNQRLPVYWSVVCAKGLSAGSRSGSFSVTTPGRHLVSHPYNHPNYCILAADAQIDRGNYLHIAVRGSTY